MLADYLSRGERRINISDILAPRKRENYLITFGGIHTLSIHGTLKRSDAVKSSRKYMSHREELTRNFQSREMVDDVTCLRLRTWVIASATFNNFSVLTIATFMIATFCKVSRLELVSGFLYTIQSRFLFRRRLFWNLYDMFSLSAAIDTA